MIQAATSPPGVASLGRCRRRTHSGRAAVRWTHDKASGVDGRTGNRTGECRLRAGLETLLGEQRVRERFGATGGIGPAAELPQMRGGNLEPRPMTADIPSQLEALVRGSGGTAVEEFTPPADTDYLSELLAIQASGPKAIGFFGTRNMGFLHQQLIEVLSYAMVLTGNHIFTSGATGTNAAVIRGALRAERPDLLTVVLPQSRTRQPPESQELLEKVSAVVEMPQNDALSLVESSRLCNADIVARVQQVICFAFHDSSLLLETCRQAKLARKMVTLFYLD